MLARTYSHHPHDPHRLKLHPNYPATDIAASSFLTPSPTDISSPSDYYNLPSPAENPSPSAPIDRPRPTRSRKDKPRIALAPDQPPTTQGKQRTRVFVACVQCRGRKIRCDGAKPSCYTCSQRLDAEPCSYDSAPKRRGPDRIQGARTRTTRPKGPDGEPLKPIRRRRRENTAVTSSVPQANKDTPPDPHQSGSDSSPSPAALTPVSSTSSQDPFAYLGRSSMPLRVDTDIPSSVELPGSNVRFTSTSYDHGLFDDLMPPAIYAQQTHTNIHPTHALELVSPQAYYADPVPSAYIVPENEEEHQACNRHQLVVEPSVEFTRKVWWDHLLGIYACAFADTPMGPSHCAPRTFMLTQTQRDFSTRRIIDDVRLVFRVSSYWFSFFNVPRFYCNFLDPARRTRIQPSLILALLAMSTFLQSSEIGRGEEGRRMAFRLRDEAQGALEASLNASAIDEEVAQAAWVLAFFEICCHPQHSSGRVSAALNLLDALLRTLALTYLDVDNPQASCYARHAVPSISPTHPAYSPAQSFFGIDGITSSAHTHHSSVQATFPSTQMQGQYPLTPGSYANSFAMECECESLSLGRVHPDAAEQTPLWVATPAWNYEWKEGDIQKEQCRRLCWSAMMLAAGYSSYFAAVLGKPLDLFITDPANFNLLFPGESLMSWSQPYVFMDNGATSTPGKESVWALYLRAMLLWHSCLRRRYDSLVPDHEKADFAMRAWLESEAIEESLNKHKCGVERAFLFYGREYLFNTRMCISFDFQKFIPHVFAGGNRKKSEEWLREQGRRAKLAMTGLTAISGMAMHNLMYRPQFVWWWMGQVSRALKLWSLDNSLTIALDVCHAFLQPIDYLTKLFPCDEQRKRYLDLREQLRLACRAAEASVGYVPRQI